MEVHYLMQAGVQCRVVLLTQSSFVLTSGSPQAFNYQMQHIFSSLKDSLLITLPYKLSWVKD
jgi:hypothetical protein